MLDRLDVVITAVLPALIWGIYAFLNRPDRRGSKTLCSQCLDAPGRRAEAFLMYSGLTDHLFRQLPTTVPVLPTV